MGNSLGGRKRMAKVMKVDGSTFKVKPPAQAAGVLRDYPGHALLDAEKVNRLGLLARPLDPDAPLKPGKLYFLVELRRPLRQWGGSGGSRRAWSGELGKLGARERLESLRLARRTASDVSSRPGSAWAAATVTGAKDGTLRIKMRLPKAQVEKLMEEAAGDAAEVAHRIMQLCAEEDQNRAARRPTLLSAPSSLTAGRKEVVFGKSISKESIEIDYLSKMCSSAVKESITNIYGQKFDYFIRNFDKSFSSSLKTLGLINIMSVNRKENAVAPGFCSYNSHEMTPDLTNSELIRTIKDPVENVVSSNCCSLSYEPTPDMTNTELIRAIEGPQEHGPFKSANNQLIIHQHGNQQLANIHRNTHSTAFSQSMLSTMERSVIEQARSNDLKTIEIELVMKKLQLKQSQLVISSDANLLEKIKISLGISKASFKEEKLRNQMQETRHAQLLQRCMDLLVAGLIVMCILLTYGAFIFSYQRVAEVASACMSVTEKSKSWWIPKGVQSFNSGMHMLRCQFVVLSRMSFGILMIVAIAYVAFQRSVKSAAAMPVTFIALLLGALCGFFGKICIDTLGGNGYRWLIDWEVLCMLHFFANAFPSVLHNLLYGPVTISQGANPVMFPYWMRRYVFYTLLLPILPISSGLLPFASFFEWKVHFVEKLTFWVSDSTS